MAFSSLLQLLRAGVAAHLKEEYPALTRYPGKRGSANMRVRARIIAVATGLLIASSAYAVNVQEVVRMITHTDLVMSDGSKMHADIVKMHGKMYVMIPVDDLPDYLHQQVVKVMP
jgi:hypothetical protein